jgi:adenosylmethionine-8-amino-7-oxononanoate aminotransferase
MDTALLMPDSSAPTVDRAEGVYIFDNVGRRYLDGCGGAMTVSIGHGVGEVIEAMHAQAAKVSFVYRTQFTNEPAKALASELTAVAPGDLNHAFFVNSGSEATELAMRVAIQYWRARGRPTKTRILGRKLSYHGMTMGALTMSGHEARRADYGDLLQDFALAAPPYDFRFPVSGPDAEGFGAGVWDRVLREEGADSIAAVIVEPIVGAAGGALTPPIGYLAALREICDRHQVLLITDEVVTGLGRTGRWFACEHDEVVPDLIACGKGLTSGYTPLGAVLFRNHIVEALFGVGHGAPFGHTFSNNPLSCSAALAVLRFMKRNAILGNVAARGEQLRVGLAGLARRFPWIADPRGRGLLWGFEFVTDPDRRTPPTAERAANLRFVERCFENGLLVYPCGIAPLNNAVIVSPPLTISELEVDDLLERLAGSLEGFGAVIDFQGWKRAGPAPFTAGAAKRL